MCVCECQVLKALATLFQNVRVPSIDLTFFCAYNASIGFKVSVDGANNIPSAKVRITHVFESG